MQLKSTPLLTISFFILTFASLFVPKSSYAQQMDLCQDLTVSSPTLSPGGTVTLTAIAKSNQITTFTYSFSNLDNLYGPGNPKPIQFTSGTNYSINRTVAASSTNSISVSYADLNRPDTNANNTYPKRIQVNSYYRIASGGYSVSHPDCVTYLTLVTPTPTPVVYEPVGGTIRSTTGVAIPNILVEVHNDTINSVRGARTDASGAFRIDNFIQRGHEYTVVVDVRAITNLGYLNTPGTSNSTRSYSTCTNANIPAGSYSYTCQKQGTNSCSIINSLSCNFVYANAPTPTPTPVPIPAAPSNVVVSASSATGPVQITWRDNSNNETRFNIYYDNTVFTGAANPNTTTFTDDTFCPAMNGKRFSVSALNAYGESAKSQSLALVCPTAPTPTPVPAPAAPSNVTNTPINSTSTSGIVVRWQDNANNETGYYVYDGNSLISQTGANTTQLNLPAANNCPASNGKRYSVQAFNTQQTSARVTASATVVCPAVTPPPAPAAPSNVVVSASTPTGAVSVVWRDNSNNETGFNIYEGTTLKGTVSANQTSFTASDRCPASNGKRYSVEAFNAGGNSARVQSAVLVCPTAATPTPTPVAVPAAPSNVTNTPVNTTATSGIVVRWQDNANNETGYYVYDGNTLISQTGANTTQLNLPAANNCPASNGKRYSVQAFNTQQTSTRVTAAATVVCPAGPTASPTQVPIPAAPSSVVVSASSATGPVQITWRDNSNNETRFNIYYDNTVFTGAANPNTTTFTDDTFCPAMNGKRFSVSALNATGESAKSQSSALVCPTAPTPTPVPAPVAPSNVTTSVSNATGPVIVTWRDNSINETGFRIYDGTTLKGQVNPNTQTFTDTARCPAQNGKRYAVESYNSVGSSSRVQSAPVVCPAATPVPSPAPPTSVRATAGNTAVSTVTVTWTNGTSPLQGSYVYQRINGGTATLIGQVSGNTAIYTDSNPGCPVSGRIQYQVQSFTASGNSSLVSSNTITCPGPTVLPAEDARSGQLIPSSGTTGIVNINSIPPKIIGISGTVRLDPINGNPTVAYIETQTQVLQPTPGLTQVEQTPVQNNDNYKIDVMWPGFTPPVTQVKIDYALIGANGMVLYSNSVTYNQVGSGPGYTPPPNTPPGPMPAGSTSIKQIGEFKTIPTSTGNFNDIKNLTINKDYWVRLTIAGDTVTPTTPSYGPSDIMLVLDITGSMDSKIYTNSAKTSSVTKLAAAKTALQQFVDNADPKDYIGFATFRVCRDLYDKSKAPIFWAYEGFSNFYRRQTGFAAVHLPLQSLAVNTQATKNLFKNTIQNMNYDFCKGSSGTDVGAGITLGTTQLSDILNDPKSVREDGTPYRISSVGTFPGSSARNGVPKYTVLATDGKENLPPRFMEPDIDNVSTTVQSAKARGIKVYTLSIGNNADAFASDMQYIATATGGKYYPGRTQQELNDAYLGILQNIDQSSGSSNIIINEKVNNTNFEMKIPSKRYPDSGYDFKVTKYDTALGGEVDITNSACNNFSCLSGTSTDGMNITLPFISDSERYYIYFKVKAKQAGIDVNVDDPVSQVVYGSGVKPLANTIVSIAGLDGYFVAEGGNVYSHSNSTTPIKSNLPLNTYFVTEDEPVVFFTGPRTNSNNTSAEIDLGNGELSPTRREIKGYTVTNGITYESLRKAVEGSISKIDITDSGVFSSSGSVGYFEDTSSTGDLFIGGSEWDKGPIQGNNIVVFVPGDLYIRPSTNGTPFRLSSDGRSSMTFVVNGRIGIDPTVTKLEGIYIANGVIDTACSTIIEPDPICGPDLKDAPLGSSLTVEGMMYSINGGFNLHRQGTPGTIPGERFVFRPDLFMNAIVALGHNQSNFRECVLMDCTR